MNFQERYLLMLAEDYQAKAEVIMEDVKAHQWLLSVLVEVEEVGFKVRACGPGRYFSICPPNTRQPICRASISVEGCSGWGGGLEYQVKLAYGDRGATICLECPLARTHGRAELRGQIHRQLILWMIERTEG